MNFAISSISTTIMRIYRYILTICMGICVYGSTVYAQQSAANNAAEAGSEATFLGIWKFADMGLFAIRLLIAIGIVFILVLVSKVFSNFISKRIRTNSIGDDAYLKKVSSLIGDIIFYILVIFAFLIGFMIIQVDFGWILGGISFGLGFAFKDILGNLMAGIMVLTNKDYRIGDVIEIDYDNRTYFGRIEEITIRYTVIKQFDMRRAIVPNLAMIMNPVRTYDTEDVIRLEIRLTVHYNTPMPQGLEIIRDAVNNVDIVKSQESTKVHLVAMGDHGLELFVYFFFDPSEGVLIQSAKGIVQEAIFDALGREHIVIPYPHTTMTVDHNDKNLLGSALYLMQQGK